MDICVLCAHCTAHADSGDGDALLCSTASEQKRVSAVPASPIGRSESLLVSGRPCAHQRHGLKNAASVFGAVLQASQCAGLSCVLMSLVPDDRCYAPTVPADSALWQSQGVEQCVWVHTSGVRQSLP